ncbi:thioredoxin domain-containing protein [Candidatus Saccharibacteria bacterium]|nr:thioredoxin domain-containing protein [Candidatus Saccharibacteria bacterium]
MKRFSGFSVGGVAAVAVIAALLIIVIVAIVNGNHEVDYSKYDFNSVIGPDSDNGNIGDHVKGEADAPVLIFEYADFQCPGCASVNTKINKIVEELDGKLAVVYRSFLLPYHQNATAAASAAEAAGLQGYWREYADKLFKEQDEWGYSSAADRTEYFKKYFVEVTDGKGDLDKFHTDISSTAVSKKISFDMGIGKAIDVSATPAFYVDGQFIDWGDSDKNGTGSVVINGETISWDGALSGDEFMNLIKKIVNTKIGK